MRKCSVLNVRETIRGSRVFSSLLHLEGHVHVHILLHLVDQQVGFIERSVVVLHQGVDVAVAVIFSLASLIFPDVVQLRSQEMHLFLVLGFDF